MSDTYAGLGAHRKHADANYETVGGIGGGTYAQLVPPNSSTGAYEEPGAYICKDGIVAVAPSASMGFNHNEEALYQEILHKPTANVDPTMNRDKAEALIRKNGTVAGSFVLRPSSSHHGSFALTVAAPNGGIKHYPIELLVEAPYTGEFLLMCPGERRRFVTLPEV